MIEAEDAIYRIIYWQNQEATSRGKMDNSSKISEILDSSNLVAEYTYQPDVSRALAFSELIKSDFLSKEELSQMLTSDDPLGNLYRETYRRPYTGSTPQIFFNWESRFSKGVDLEDKSIRHLYLFADGVTFRFKFEYSGAAPKHLSVSNTPAISGSTGNFTRTVKDNVSSVSLSTKPMIDMTIHEFPPEGEFGHMAYNVHTPFRREFRLYADEDLLFDYFDARFLEPEPCHYLLHSMEVGPFGKRAKYVDRCLNLLYEILTTTPEIISPSPSL